MWPEGYGRHVLAETDSTNAEATRRAGQGAGPEWILALRQSAARGRRGRPWSMPAGNFAATLLLPVSEPPQVVALRSFVAALALHGAFCAVTGRAEGLALKWPNDVLLNGGKVAGILLENLGPVSLLSETGVEVTPEEFLTVLARCYAEEEARFATLGFAAIRAAWLSRAARLGEVITARTGRVEMTGTFETVDDAGNLVLITAGGRQAIAAADVFF